MKHYLNMHTRTLSVRLFAMLALSNLFTPVTACTFTQSADSEVYDVNQGDGTVDFPTWSLTAGDSSTCSIEHIISVTPTLPSTITLSLHYGPTLEIFKDHCHKCD